MPGQHSSARRVWCELLDPAEVRRDGILAALRERDVQLVLAVRPSHVHDVAQTVRAARQSGVSIALWPMLADADGRWVNADNAAVFLGFVVDMLTRLESEDALPDEIAIDLEPPITDVRSVLRGDLRPLGRWRSMPRTISVWSRIVDEARRRNVTPWAAVVPLVLADGRRRTGWQRMLATPVDAPGFERFSPMLYTSIARGYTRGFLRRADARALLWRCANAARNRWGARASVSLGAVAAGALGDEQTYRSAEELADDVAIVRAAGIDDIALFDLGGAIRRGPVDAWLDALVGTAAATDIPPATTRDRAIAALALAVGRALG